MTKENQNIDIKLDFKLTKIELINSNLYYNDKIIFNNQTFQFNITIEHKIDIVNKTLIVAPEIIVEHKDKKTELGRIKIACIYNIMNLKDFIDVKGSEIYFPNEIVAMFNSISLSTARGIMFSQFRGTNLHNAILPVIPDISLSNMIKSKKEEKG